MNFLTLLGAVWLIALVEGGAATCACRRDARWGSECFENCSNHTGWFPRSRWWRLGSLETDGDPVWVHPEHLDEFHYPLLDCLVDVMGVKADSDEWRDLTLSPDITNSKVAVIPKALSNSEAQQVLGLKDCVIENLPSHFERRGFDHEDDNDQVQGNEFNGNLCTYLTPHLQLALPGVAAQIVHIVEIARIAQGWPVPARELGIRTAEHLAYKHGSHLSLHVDDESVYTIVIALSDPDEYEGGEFIVAMDGEGEGVLADFKPERLSAVVFQSSTTYHKLRPILKGTRETFAIELWNYDDNGFDIYRGSSEITSELIMEKLEAFEEEFGILGLEAHLALERDRELRRLHALQSWDVDLSKVKDP